VLRDSAQERLLGTPWGTRLTRHNGWWNPKRVHERLDSEEQSLCRFQRKGRRNATGVMIGPSGVSSSILGWVIVLAVVVDVVP
jgi:hypothetical protein